MKKKLKLKPYVMPSIYVAAIMIFAISAMTTFEDMPERKEDVTYVSNVILSNDTPVVSTNEIVIIRPYNDREVKIGKNFYNYASDEQSQQNSIVYYENTYMQNSGVDYVKTDSFDVISILKGTVISVNNNELLGNTIEIKHDNNLISVYQSLESVTIKEGDSVEQGQILGKSGQSKINKELGKHLHFELFKEGQVVNPEEYYNKNIKDI
ncbi:MAG: M23 family metallopeptidase [Bacilli bacterium]|nr:M23 family metallopeptidase [Bacilli bacterium]